MAEAAKAPNSLSGVTTLTLDIFGIRCMMGQPAANEGGDQVTTEDRKREIFAQPSAAKEVYAPEGHYVNSTSSSGGLMASGTCSTSRLTRVGLWGYPARAVFI